MIKSFDILSLISDPEKYIRNLTPKLNYCNNTIYSYLYNDVWYHNDHPFMIYDESNYVVMVNNIFQNHITLDKVKNILCNILNDEKRFDNWTFKFTSNDYQFPT
jgi:hypothetical protein